MLLRLIRWATVLFIIWLGMTNTIDWQSLAVGGILSIFISVIFLNTFEKKTGELNRQKIKLINPFKVMVYLIIFIKNLILANIDVAKIVINPKLPINPGIVEIETKADTDFKKLVIANSITLTPGTITLDNVGNKMYVHWIKVTTENMEEAGDLIKGDFEKHIN